MVGQQDAVRPRDPSVGATIDALVEAREHGRDPFDVLDETVGWIRLVSTRDEVDQLGDLATEDSLSAGSRAVRPASALAPAFPDAFDFDAPDAGRSLRAAIELLRELNRSGRRKLPDVVPMPFAGDQWKSAVTDSDRSRGHGGNWSVEFELNRDLTSKGIGVGAGPWPRSRSPVRVRAYPAWRSQ